MLQIFLACGAVVAVAAFARGRGVPAVAAGLAAAAGWVSLGVLIASGTLTPRDRSLATALACGWVALIAAGVWFISGPPRPVPVWPWPCSECRYANSRDVLECESCGAPWKPDAAVKNGEAV